MYHLEDSLLLPYAECLSRSKDLKIKNKGVSLLRHLIERNFTNEQGKWDPYIRCFKTFISQLDETSSETISVLSKLLIGYPHSELCLKLAEKLYSISPEENLSQVCLLLEKSLSDSAFIFSMVRRGEFQKEKWIKTALEDMMLHHNSTVNKLALECIQKPLISSVIPQKELASLKEKMLISSLKRMDTESIFSKTDCNDLLIFAIKIKDQIEDKHEVQKYLNKLYCNCWRANIEIMPLQIFEKGGTFPEIEEMIAVYSGFKKSPENCLFSYSLFREMLIFNLAEPQTQGFYRLVIDIARKLLKREELDSDEHYYSLIYAAYYLKEINVYYPISFQLSEIYFEIINHALPEEVCRLLEKREFKEENLSALKYIFLISKSTKIDTFDTIKYRENLSILMNDNNCLNFMMIIDSLEKIGELKFAKYNKSRFEIFEKISEYVERLDGMDHGKYYLALSKKVENTYDLVSEPKMVPDIRKIATKSLDDIILFLNKGNHSFKQTKILLAAFPPIIKTLFSHDLSNSTIKLFPKWKIQECFQLFESKTEEWLQMKAIKTYDIECANNYLISFIHLRPNKASLLNDGIKRLIKIGKNTRREGEFIEAGTSLLKQAKDKGIYLKELKLYGEVSQALNLKSENTSKKKKSNLPSHSEAFALIKKGVKENQLVEFFKQLSISSDIKKVETEFSFLTTFSFNSPKNCQECWLFIMQALLKGRSDKFKEILANQVQFLSIFDPKEISNAKAYELLLKGTTHALRKSFDATTLNQLLTIVHQFFKPYQENKRLLDLEDSLLLPYAECLVKSANQTSKESGRDLLKQLVERNFKRENGKWDPLVKGFKRTISQLDKKSSDFLSELSNMLIKYPHFELCLKLAQKLYTIDPKGNLPRVSLLLKHGLSDGAAIFSLAQRGKIRGENWIQKALEEMMLHHHPTVSKVAVEFIDNPSFELIIPQKEAKEKILISLLEKIDNNILTKKIFDDILNFTIKIKNQIVNKEKVQKYLNKLYRCCWDKDIKFLPIQIVENGSKFSEIEELIADFNEAKKSPEDCIFSYSLYSEMLTYNLENHLKDKFYKLLIQIAGRLNEREDLYSDEYFYIMIYSSFFLKRMRTYFSYELSEDQLTSINHTNPDKVCRLLEGREFQNEHLSTLKDIFLLSEGKKIEAIPAEYRSKLLTLMKDNNCLNFKITINLMHEREWEKFDTDYLIRSELFENLLDCARTLAGDSPYKCMFDLCNFLTKELRSKGGSNERLNELVIKSFDSDILTQFLNLGHLPSIMDKLFCNLSISKIKIPEEMIKKCFNLYKLKMAEWLYMIPVNLDNIHFVTKHIYHFIDIMPKKDQASLTNDWIRTLMVIGEHKESNGEFFKAGYRLLDSCSKAGIYLKRSKDYKLACQILKIKQGNTSKKK